MSRLAQLWQHQQMIFERKGGLILLIVGKRTAQRTQTMTELMTGR
ncbi:hypothetical protein STH22820_29700 [Edwardsiella ictaluri]|nr:hypothetical protein STH22820_29700 [Edwardsiella ictaluri]